MIQEQVLIAYVSEVERSKQPGYVCRYDDHEDYDDTPLSYSAMVSDMARPSGYKAHGPHVAPRGTHLEPEPVAAR